VVAGIRAEKHLHHLASEDHRMTMFALELWDNCPDLFRHGIHKPDFQCSERLRSCRRPIYECDACGVSSAIEHCLKTFAQRTELSPFRLPVVHHISRILVDHRPQQISVIARHYDHEIARALEKLDRSSKKRPSTKLQQSLVFAHARRSACGKHNSG